MRIAVFVTEFPKFTETFTLREAMELRELGNDVRIFHLTPFRSNEIVHAFARPLVDSATTRPWLVGGGVFSALLRTLLSEPRAFADVISTLILSYWRSPKLLAKSLAIVPKCLRFSEDLREWGADHVHASFAGHPATAAWIVSRLGGPAYSITSHAHDIFISQLMLAEKFKSAAFVRTISEFNARFLRREIGEEACLGLQVLHCGVDVPKSVQERVETPDLKILFVGSLQYRKGVHVLLPALKQLQSRAQWTCRIVGDGPMRQSLQEMVKSLELTDRVTFLGAKSAEEVAQEYLDADLLVTPSIDGPEGRCEGIPTVLMEALSVELPVIASRQTGIPELVEDNETGLLVLPGDVDALAEAIDRIQSDRAMARRLAAKGRIRVAQEFNLPRNVARLNQLISGTETVQKLTANREVAS